MLLLILGGNVESFAEEKIEPYKSTFNKGLSKQQRLSAIEKQLSSVSNRLIKMGDVEQEIDKKIEKKMVSDRERIKQLEEENKLLMKRIKRLESYVDIPGKYNE